MRFIAFASSLFLMLAAATAQSAAPMIELTHVWTRATIGASTNGVVYLTITNHQVLDDKLISVATPAADKADLHTNIDDNGVMKMRALADLPVKAGETVSLKPQGDHIMLMGLKQKLLPGTEFPLTLVFEKAGTIETSVTVEKLGSDDSKMSGPMSGMKM